MAAGEGTRLRPLTERWPKPVLPIDGRPVLATLLRELAAAEEGREHWSTVDRQHRFRPTLGQRPETRSPPRPP